MWFFAELTLVGAMMFKQNNIILLILSLMLIAFMPLIFLVSNLLKWRTFESIISGFFLTGVFCIFLAKFNSIKKGEFDHFGVGNLNYKEKVSYFLGYGLIIVSFILVFLR